MTKITFNAPRDCEIYIVFDNMTIDTTGLYKVAVKTNKVQKSVFVRGYQNHCYFPMPYVSINMGCYNDEIVTCYIDEALNQVTFDNVYVYALPLAVFRDGVKNLQQNTLTGISYSKTGTSGKQNYLSGKISAQNDGVLQLGVPYSKGWKVYIDGQRVNRI